MASGNTTKTREREDVLLIKGEESVLERLGKMAGELALAAESAAPEEAMEALARREGCVVVRDLNADSAGAWRWLEQARRCGFEIPLICIRNPSADRLPEDEPTLVTDQARPLPSTYYDPLTGLPNRALFTEWLARAIERAEQQDGYRFAVLLLDLDRFKIVNDSLGHETGDRLLIRVARRLLGHLRFSDAVARISGDEFTILLDDVEDASDAVRIAERVHAALKDPFLVSGQEIFPTVSIGIALSATGYDRPEEMLQDAETAMYRAKGTEAGYEIFDPEMRRKARDVLLLESDLRGAMERREFQLYYQPILSMSESKVLGFEALLRWHHPERGFVSPAEFIPVAEETGLIVPIGDWVLEEACRQLALWQKDLPLARNLTMNVNLSRKQLCDGDLVRRVEEILTATRLEPSHLKLEITESMVMEREQAAIQVLARLRSLGVYLCVDDFGTGYSSLSCLHRLPIQTIKIDRSFVSRMGLDVESSEIVRTIVALARNLNKKVVAEGVETLDQLSRLEALGCDQAQGFLFSKPVCAGEAEALIERAYLLTPTVR
ncbi:MAG: EAL domain-containing protein [Acidobacteriota bacterium]|nr:EAL domain-containing protein [Acidobacteriota bacterium]MDQ7086982.1 EAL domain-containing protein [Acidobacteriota bacterium]